MKGKVKKVLDKIKLKCVTDKRKVILGVISSFIIISLIGFSYALFSVSVEQSNTFTIVAGELTYILKSDKLNSNREITVSPNEIQVLNFEITSQIEFGTLYQIYYEGTNDDNVKVSYYKNDYYSGIGTIDAKATVNIQVVINNRSNDPVTIKFGVQGGLLDRTLTLNQGLGLNEYEIGDIVITYSYEGYGIAPNGFPKKGDGYKVKSVDCDSGTAVWDLNTWSLDVSLITNTGSICNVVFEDSSIYLDPSNANEPELIEGLIPVVYDEGSKNWVKADTNTAWYDYGSQVWANAVTVIEANRANYMSASAGTAINMNDINTMWVWIPRYEYMYTNLGTQYAGGTQAMPGEIKVNFISKNTILPSDATNYKVHPGFIFGNQQLAGFWFAKFETSSSNATVANYGEGIILL